ncbi:hypothetical protein SG34_032730 [Thalassomonas viridans]|uniref:Uncharacterized protein n=1 Tax=Thalassomonas viridans TaxID=137584 RepID=A0AAE9ZCP1_9GAMM|nr:hypothetical protein [Thalassomonas viridans]WDE08678.1 hypothetical protein SG34_032730 [Thalassomonas viridans]
MSTNIKTVFRQSYLLKKGRIKNSSALNGHFRGMKRMRSFCSYLSKALSLFKRYLPDNLLILFSRDRLTTMPSMQMILNNLDENIAALKKELKCNQALRDSQVLQRNNIVTMLEKVEELKIIKDELVELINIGGFEANHFGKTSDTLAENALATPGKKAIAESFNSNAGLCDDRHESRLFNCVINSLSTEEIHDMTLKGLDEYIRLGILALGNVPERKVKTMDSEEVKHQIHGYIRLQTLMNM